MHHVGSFVRSVVSDVWYSVGSNEASWDPGETGADADTWSQLVRPAIVCDDGRRPIWGTHVAHFQSQVMNPPAVACHLPYTRCHKTHICCDTVHSGGKLVKWSGSVVVPSMITSLLRGWQCTATSVNDTKCSLSYVVKFFLKFAWICSNKLMGENRDGARRESKEIKFED